MLNLCKHVPVEMTVGEKRMGRMGWQTVGWHCDFRNTWCQHRSLPVWLEAERKWGSEEKGKKQGGKELDGKSVAKEEHRDVFSGRVWQDSSSDGEEA